MSAERKARRLGAATLVADRLGDSEAAIDVALGKLARFLADLPDAREKAQVAAPFGHQVYAELAGAYQLLVESRGRIVAAHTLLEDAREDLRLPRLDTMPGGDKPPTGTLVPATPLRVATAA